jgi:GTP-binding protein
VALAGRSNVGKSSLINALVRRDVARTSTAPGKTRLVNLYRVELDGRAGPFYLVDLPGYGHAGGGEQTAREFDRLTGEYFRDEGSGIGDQGSEPRGWERRIAGVVLAIDARHPGLARDVAAHVWLSAQPAPLVLVATKIDKLSQAERARLGRHTATSFGVAALEVSSVTGEGLEQLWTHLLKWIRRN